MTFQSRTVLAFSGAAVVVLVAACGSSDDDEQRSAGGGGGTTAGSGASAATGGARVDGGNTGSGAAGASGGAGASASGGAGASASGGAGAGGEAGAAAEACEELTTFESGRAPTAVLHVALDGSPGAPGSEAEPLDSIESAAALATPGTAIRVHAGTYPGDLFLAGLEGTAERPIWIGGAPGEAPPVIGEAGNGQAIQLSGARYLILHDLVIENAGSNGINADDAANYDDPEVLRHLVFRNLSFRAIGAGGNQDCLKLSGAHDFWVLDSEFANCSAGGSGIDQVGCHDGVISGNVFLEGGNGVQAKGGSSNISIRGNLFRLNAGRAVNLGGSTGYEFFRPSLSSTEDNFEASGVRVTANVFDRVSEALAFVGCVDCSAAHNTVYLPSVRIVRILQETTSDALYTFLPSSGGQLVNNVFFYSKSEIANDGRAINVGAGTSPESFTWTNNLWYASDATAASEPAAGAYAGGSVSGSIAGEDPAFADAANGDFAIDEGSPAAATGLALPDVPADFSGRCYLTPRSVGALEVATAP